MELVVVFQNTFSCTYKDILGVNFFYILDLNHMQSAQEKVIEHNFATKIENLYLCYGTVTVERNSKHTCK